MVEARAGLRNAREHGGMAGLGLKVGLVHLDYLLRLCAGDGSVLGCAKWHCLGLHAGASGPGHYGNAQHAIVKRA